MRIGLGVAGRWVSRRVCIIALVIGVLEAALLPMVSADLMPGPRFDYYNTVYGYGPAEGRDDLWVSAYQWRWPAATRFVLELQRADSEVFPAGFTVADYPPVDLPHWARVPDSVDSGKVVAEARGWPMRSMSVIATVDRGVNISSVSGGVLRSGIRSWRILLPLTPVPLGFAVDTLVTAGAVVLIVMLFNVIRRTARFERGRCPDCGYILGGRYDAPCPECGSICHPATERTNTGNT